MTAFVTTDIPSSVDTVEKLAVWALSILRANFPSIETTEAAGYVERSVLVNTFFVPSTGKQLVIGRVSLEIDPAFQGSGTGKFWTFVRPLGSTATPAGFKSN